jgi:hypothetical protein
MPASKSRSQLHSVLAHTGYALAQGFQHASWMCMLVPPTGLLVRREHEPADRRRR